ncbi:glycosyltransferase [Aequorivita sp. H23M31]|uniref:Glycosyltransferase n=1 Tax=Aequorivita ciconiae TaxID=2494375 RepID=A0A410G648_9FLAO|nr:TIGR04283 family arsenosugar biosynthesis glycosyltransferase [Aequorivita sp. H23M31]QAA82768.1 glycosyltransferase [Aequorivita sp. H23M31]
MLSIIIPVLNEAETIVELLSFVSENLSGENDVEIICVDGGSEDATPELIQDFSKPNTKDPSTSPGVRSSRLQFTLTSSEKGRAIQMNKGARVAAGNILYFLHADSFPPKNFDKYILEEIEKRNPAGCFRMKFDSNHWWLSLAGWFTQFNLKAFRGGDQSQFITKSVFEEIGGFNEKYTIYEDNILISQLYKRKKFVVIQQNLTTSARRYRENGIWNLQFHFWMIHLKQRSGAAPEELYKYYKRHIESKRKK